MTDSSSGDEARLREAVEEARAGYVSLGKNAQDVAVKAYAREMAENLTRTLAPPDPAPSGEARCPQCRSTQRWPRPRFTSVVPVPGVVTCENSWHSPSGEGDTGEARAASDLLRFWLNKLVSEAKVHGDEMDAPVEFPRITAVEHTSLRNFIVRYDHAVGTAPIGEGEQETARCEGSGAIVKRHPPSGRMGTLPCPGCDAPACPNREGPPPLRDVTGDHSEEGWRAVAEIRSVQPRAIPREAEARSELEREKASHDDTLKNYTALEAEAQALRGALEQARDKLTDGTHEAAMEAEAILTRALSPTGEEDG